MFCCHAPFICVECPFCSIVCNCNLILPYYDFLLQQYLFLFANCLSWDLTCFFLLFMSVCLFNVFCLILKLWSVLLHWVWYEPLNVNWSVLNHQLSCSVFVKLWLLNVCPFPVMLLCMLYSFDYSLISLHFVNSVLCFSFLLLLCVFHVLHSFPFCCLFLCLILFGFCLECAMSLRVFSVLIVVMWLYNFYVCGLH